jgi:ATP-dependent Clp protease ATP-binding subunit ClpA
MWNRLVRCSVVAEVLSRWDPGDLFDRFAPGSHDVVNLARAEADDLGHNHVGVEHLLLGLLRQEEGVAAEVLRSLDVTVDRVRARLLAIVPASEAGAPSPKPPSSSAPFTPRAKRVLELSLRESLSHGSTAVGTEHILLALARENESIAARILLDLGADQATIRNAIPVPAPVPGLVVPASRERRVFGRFSERARQVVALAQAEAREIGFSHIGTEAVLLGLLREEDGLAARVLASFDVTLELARAEVVKRLGGGDGIPESTVIPFTPRAQAVLDRARHEAFRLGHNYVGTEHILLSMAAVDEGEGINALRTLGVDSSMIRNEVIRLLTADTGRILERKSEGSSRERQPFAQDDRLWVGQDAEVTRLMRSAAARALDDGRNEITARDLLIALSRDGSTGPLLTELGADEAAIREALERHGGPERPPAAPEPG